MKNLLSLLLIPRKTGRKEADLRAEEDHNDVKFATDEEIECTKKTFGLR